ncbi:MAG TPA: hypothetical protein VI461_13035 [Chitinophagaceae bacterium]|nr:hypothetical protein [Chitinophagaceae bacterium]
MSKLRLKASLGNLPKNKRIDVNVLIVTFVEDSLYYYYAPQLDVYGYGQTETEAKDSFEITLHEFFRYTLNKGTLQDELKRLGWKLQKKTKAILAPDFSRLLQSSTDLKDIVENRSFTKTQHLIQMPAVA